jgi:hypothetical protein
MPMLRTLNLELELHPLDNGEIVLARTKKTQLIPQDFAQNALQFFMQVPFIQQQNFKMAIAASDTKPNNSHLFRLVDLADTH